MEKCLKTDRSGGRWNWRFTGPSLEECLEDRWEWRGKNWRVHNSSLEEGIGEEWDKREKNSRSSIFSSALPLQTFSGSCEEPPAGQKWSRATPNWAQNLDGRPMQVGQIIVVKTLLSRQSYRHGGTVRFGGLRQRRQLKNWLIS